MLSFSARLGMRNEMCLADIDAGRTKERSDDVPPAAKALEYSAGRVAPVPAYDPMGCVYPFIGICVCTRCGQATCRFVKRQKTSTMCSGKFRARS